MHWPTKSRKIPWCFQCQWPFFLSLFPGYRVRERRVLREGLYGGKSCEHTKETQPCHYPPCYYWRAVPSGVCQLKYPEFQCGDGSMARDAECVSRRGVSETETETEKKLKGKLKLRETLSYVVSHTAKALCMISSIHRSDVKASDRCIVDIWGWCDIVFDVN